MQDSRQTIESPCIGVCSLGPDDICRGCQRSRNEIAMWTACDDEQKRVIIERARQRRSGSAAQ